MKIMTLTKEEAPANFVPAAAVIRKVLALFKMIGRKEFVGCIFDMFYVKDQVHRLEMHL